jgi:hypothetical protein
MNSLRITIIVLALCFFVAFGSAQSLQPQFFGIDVLHATNATPWPSQPYAGIRLWDTDDTGWPQLNPSRGQYNWSALDNWLALARKHNVDVLYTFGRVPAWANNGKGQSVPPTDLADWDAFVRAIATHSKGKIKFWEVWNEPNEPKFWTGDIPTLVTMAQHAQRIIKSVDPSAIVLTPSATWTTTSPAQWFDQYFAAGGAQYADAIAFHGYVGPTPEGIVSNLQQIWSVAGKYSINIPIWNTEGSWGIDAKIADPASQANFLARYYILQVSQGVQRFYWYAWDGSDGGKNAATESWGTLWDRNGRHSAANAYGTLRNWLLTAQLPLLCTANNSVWQCTLNSQSLIVWTPAAQQHFQTDPRFTHYFDLAGQSHAIANHVVPIGPAPVLLQ